MNECISQNMRQRENEHGYIIENLQLSIDSLTSCTLTIKQGGVRITSKDVKSNAKINDL